jgi:hypothetical protein
MGKFYSKTTNGFYDSAINVTMPPDAISITDAVYSSLMAAQSSGQLIQGDAGGNPIAVTPAAPVVTLADAQVAACNALMTNLDQFTLYLPSGMPRYSVNFNFSAVLYAMKNGATATPITSLSAWMAAVQAAYISQETAIMACTDVAEVAGVDISVAWFEARYGVSGTVVPDPNITLRDLAT